MEGKNNELQKDNAVRKFFSNFKNITLFEPAVSRYLADFKDIFKIQDFKNTKSTTTMIVVHKN